MLIFVGSLPDSNLLARFTLLPNRQYLGMRAPTTPAKTDPVWMPILICIEKEQTWITERLNFGNLKRDQALLANIYTL